MGYASFWRERHNAPSRFGRIFSPNQLRVVRDKQYVTSNYAEPSQCNRYANENLASAPAGPFARETQRLRLYGPQGTSVPAPGAQRALARTLMKTPLEPKSAAPQRTCLT
jgi:hypothetical protein